MFCSSIACLCLLLLSGFTRSADIPCPQGWRAFNDYCYLVSKQLSSGTDAPLFCIEKGGELVKIENERENEFILALARKEAPPSVKSIWIGLKRNGGHWYWSDNSLPKYSNWAPNEPSNPEEKCTNMYIRHSDGLPYKASGSWNDLFCPGVTSVVCKRLP